MDHTDTLLLAKARRLASTGEALNIRLEAGLSVGDVARAIGGNVSTIWRWERGQRAPRGGAAIAWAQLMNELAASLRRTA